MYPKVTKLLKGEFEMTRKKLLILLGSVCLALMMVAMACAGPAPTTPAPTTPAPTTPAPSPTAEVYKWRFQSAAVAAMTEWQFGPLRDSLHEMSNGRIELELYATDVLVPDVELPDSLSEGVLDMAQSYACRHADILDVGNIAFGLAFTWASGDDCEVVGQLLGLDDLLAEAYAELGVKFINQELETEYYILSTKPIKTIEDLAKIKMRATASNAPWLADLGVAAMYIPAAELYTSLSRGIVDGVLYGGAVDYSDMGLFEIAKYVVKPSVLYPTKGEYIMCLDLWNSLPGDIQAIVTAACKVNSRWIYNEFQRREWICLADAVKNQGVTVTWLSAEDQAKVMNAAKVVWEEEAAKSPRAARGMEIVKDWLRTTGRL
ncbi:hypothetical protein ES707_01073 [subsurface metagenome]